MKPGEDKAAQPISMARLFFRLVMGIVILCLLLFLPAGTWRWPEAWLFMLIYVIWLLIAIPWLWRHDPKLLEKRMAWTRAPIRGWDKLYTYGSALIAVPMMAFIGMDAVRFGWSQVPTSLKALAFASFFFSFSMFLWVVRVNSYLSRIVEIQKESGHKVVTTGPYAIVRHPMYLAAVVLYFALPLALGSYYGLCFGAVLVGLLVFRTIAEDRTLHAELEGYVAYAQKVRYRLLPGIW